MIHCLITRYQLHHLNNLELIADVIVFKIVILNIMHISKDVIKG